MNGQPPPEPNGGASLDARQRAIVEEAFATLVSLPPGERDAALGRLCGGDAAVEAEVRSLLAYHADSDAALDPQEVAWEMRVSTGQVPDDAVLPPGTRLGEFTLERVIGVGGMGRVYEARQDRPQRRVAIKVLRSGGWRGDVRRRFEHEADVLARLHHPGIAQVFGAGTSEIEGTGVAQYIAMELVRGLPITEHARALSLAGRVELLLRVCESVQHAHERGVIHRDLKPANILVDAGGQPKVLDFGVARLVGHERTLQTMQTGAGQLIGTLAYMSPEHVSGDPDAVDSRSDVYALGAIAYEVLGGTPAVDVHGLSVLEAMTRIRNWRPVPLGERSRECRGDLETIAASAMHTDPSRRYSSAAALADDLRRFLAGDPVAARADSALYVARAQLKRYRTGVAVAAALVIAATIFSVLLVRQIGRERLARTVAQQQTALADTRARQTSQMLRASLLERGRLLVDAGNLRGAEELLNGLHREDPTPQSAWALWNLAARMPRLATLAGHGTEVRCVTLSADESWFVSGDRRGEVILWETPTLRRIAAIPANGELVLDIAVSPTGAAFAVAGSRGNLRLFTKAGDAVAYAGCIDVPGLTTVRTLGTGVPWRLLVSSERGPLWVVDEQLRVVRELEVDGSDEGRGAVEVASDAAGQTIAAVREDGSILVWRGERERPVSTLALDVGDVYALAMSRDGSRVMVGGDRVSRWIVGVSIDPLTAELQVTGASRWTNGTVRYLQFHPDGQRVLATGYHRCEIVDAETALPLPSRVRFGQGALGAAWSTRFSRIIVSEDSDLRVWYDSADGYLRRVPAHRGAASAVASAGDVVFSGGADGLVRAWRLDVHGQLVPEYELAEHVGRVRSLHLSADARTLVSAGSEDARGRVVVWDLGRRRPRTIIELGKPAYSVRLAPDGSWVATSARDGHVRVFDAGDGRLVHDSDVGTIDTLNLTLLGENQLVSLHSAGRTIVWNTGDWSRRADIGLFELGWSGAPIPGRPAAMIGTWSGGLATLESSGVVRPLPSPHTQMISDMVVEPLPTPLLPNHEQRLVAISASTDGLLGLTDVESRATLATLPVDSQGLTAAAVAGRGRCLLTAHIDGTIGVVDTPRIEALARVNLEENHVRPVDTGRR